MLTILFYRRPRTWLEVLRSVPTKQTYVVLVQRIAGVEVVLQVDSAKRAPRAATYADWMRPSTHRVAEFLLPPGNLDVTRGLRTLVEKGEDVTHPLAAVVLSWLRGRRLIDTAFERATISALFAACVLTPAIARVAP